MWCFEGVSQNSIVYVVSCILYRTQETKYEKQNHKIKDSP